MTSQNIVLLIVLSFAPSFFWLVFYYFYSPRSTTPKKFLGFLFFLGMIAALLGIVIHQNVLLVLPSFILESFKNSLAGVSSYQISDTLILFSLMLFLVAPIEEMLKFLAIALVVKKKPEYIDQIIDGIKAGVVVGLGFAVIENGFYFYQPLFNGEAAFLLKIFLIRFFISTLAHSLYTGIIGYYFSLSRFYRLHSQYLIRKGIFIAIIMHGIFNFLLLVNLGFFSIAILIVLLWLMVKWYQDRESLEKFISESQYQKIFVPIFSEKKEFESVLFKQKIKYEIIKKLNLCPFCFRVKISGQDVCRYCKTRQPI